MHANGDDERPPWISMVFPGLSNLESPRAYLASVHNHTMSDIKKEGIHWLGLHKPWFLCLMILTCGVQADALIWCTFGCSFNVVMSKEKLFYSLVILLEMLNLAFHELKVRYDNCWKPQTNNKCLLCCLLIS